MRSAGIGVFDASRGELCFERECPRLMLNWSRKGSTHCTMKPADSRKDATAPASSAVAEVSFTSACNGSEYHRLDPSLAPTGDLLSSRSHRRLGSIGERLWQRLLGRPASESGTLCRGDRAQGAADAAGEC